MTDNLLITGPPRAGKTTVIRRVRDRLEAHGHRPGGICSPDLRADGNRVGFEIADLMTGDSRVMAHVDRGEGPQVGKYRVNVAAVDAVCSVAFPRAFEDADVVLVDEIAPMEAHSEVFVRQLRRAFDADIPLVAAIHHRSTEGIIGECKDRDDTDLFDVTDDTRDSVPAILIDELGGYL